MGQYYTAVVTQGDKTTLFKPDWVKITEHSWVGNFFMDTVVSRLYNRKGRVAWVGDYTSDIMEEVVSNDGTKAPLAPSELYAGCYYKRNADGTLYHNEKGYIEEDETTPLPSNIKVSKRKHNEIKMPLNGKVIINLTRKEYIIFDTYYKRSVTDDGWCLHPVSLLTSTGGDQGGGDYHKGCIDAHQVGRWAYDEIIIKDCTPRRVAKLNKDGFSELIVTFNETMKDFVAGVK